MAALIFYALPQSPYCSKVRVALRIKDIDFTEAEPDGGSYQTTAYQQHVAAGSIPAIRIGDWVLHDSQAIIEYLEEIYPQPAIWSDEPQLRAAQRALVHYHDSRLEPAVRAFVPFIKQPESRDRTLQLEKAQDDLFDRLYRLDKLLAAPEFSGCWLGGQSPCVADWSLAITTQMALDILDHLQREIRVADSINGLIEQAGKHKVIVDEMARLRGAVNSWLVNEDLTRHSLN